jgi:PBP1b-binding outer membrane lipoprotein LpoB
MFRTILAATLLLASCTSTHELKVVPVDIEKPNVEFKKPSLEKITLIKDSRCPAGFTCLEENEITKIIGNEVKRNEFEANLIDIIRYYKNIK